MRFNLLDILDIITKRPMKANNLYLEHNITISSEQHFDQ